MRITAADVARRAGVSQSAVSRVFTPGASASARTAEKVRRAAEELGYRPNVLARAMITGRSRIIGLIVAYLENQFYPLALQLLARALKAEGYHVLVFMASNGEDVDKMLDDLLDYQVDGIVTASVGMSNALTARCAAAGIPVVMFNRGQDGADVSSVTSANRAGGQQVAEFLLAGGHRRLGHISGWLGASTGRDRAAGFAAGLAAAGAEPVALVDGLYRQDHAAAVARDMIRNANPDAIFVGNDHMAFAVLDTLRTDLGIDVPAEVSIIGYDDVPMAAWPAYGLTTVRQPINRMVAATVSTLLAQIEAPERPVARIELAGDLILRTSARQPEGWHDGRL